MNLDREIAEKVMGWKEGKDFSFKDGIVYRECSYWQPSGFIQHAMEVEAEMFRRGYGIEMARRWEKTGLGWGKWVNMFIVTFFDNRIIRGINQSESLPEAICKSAIAALEES